MNNENDLNRYWTMVTPDNAALLLIDHQVKLMLGVQTLDAQTLRDNSLALAETAKIFNLPVVLTGGSPGDPLMPELSEVLPKHEFVRRTTVNAWETPEYVAAVEQTGRKKLIMAGITTDLCLLFPAISAVKAGYDVYIVVDASGCFNQMIEQAALMRMTQAGCVMTTWASIAAELNQDGNWMEGRGPQVMKLYTERLGTLGLIAPTVPH